MRRKASSVRNVDVGLVVIPLHISFNGSAHAPEKAAVPNSPGKALSSELYDEFQRGLNSLTISHHLGIIDYDAPIQC